MADGKVVIETGLDSSGIEEGLSKLGGLAKTGLAVVTGAITGVSAALAGAGAASVKLGSDFETSMAKASTLFGDVNVNTANLNAKVLELSDSTGVASNEIGNSLYNALSAGIPVTEDMGAAMTYMEQCAKLAKAGFTDVDTVVTSTAKVLNAYKMDVSETGNVHKILMQVQNKGITTVGELGASLAQVTPTAAAMNVSFEQVGAALATMTAQGTPTAQATTQLNSLFAELGKQGTVASKALEKSTEGTELAGKGFADLMAEGVPLNKVLDLMGVTADMSDQSLIDMFGSIEAGKAALAMSGKNAEQYTSNMAAMGTQVDVVGDAYEKMSNTFQEKSKQLIESTKNLGISIYQDMVEPLKGAAEEGIKCVEQLSDAFENGGLQGMVAIAGDIFADLAVKAAEQAPVMIDSAVNLIQSFIDGIVSNKDKLYTAAVEIVHALAGGVAKLLPSELRKPAEEAVDALAKSFQSGGLKNAANSIVTMFEDIVKVAGALASVTLPVLTAALDLCGDNLHILVPLLVAGYTAFKGYIIVKTISGFLTKAGAASKAYAAATTVEGVAVKASSVAHLLLASTMNAAELVVGVLTGRVSLMTAATAALNTALNSNPMILVTTAAIGLTAAIAALIYTTSRETEEQKNSAEMAEKRIATADKEIEKAKERAVAFQEVCDSQNQQAAADIAQIDNTQALYKELQTLVDANGNITAENEERAAFIANELSGALGIEIELTNGQITGYQELQGEITSLIQKKREQAVLAAEEVKYQEAVNNQMALAKEQSELNTQQKQLETAAKAANAEMTLLETQANEAALSENKADYKAIMDKVAAKQSEIDGLETSVAKTKEAYAQNQATMGEYVAAMDNYKNLTDAIASGNADAVNAAIISITAGLKTATTANQVELAQQVTDLAQVEQFLVDQVNAGTTGYTQAWVDQAHQATEQAKAELAAGQEGMSAEGKNLIQATVNGMQEIELTGAMSAKARESLEGFLGGFAGLDTETKDVWAQALFGAIAGLEGFEKVADPAKEGAEAFLESLRVALDTHSPSVAVQAIFANVWPGATEGLKEGKEGLAAEGQGTITTFLDGLKNSGLAEGAREIGSNIMSLFGVGVSSQSGNSQAAGQQNANAANVGAGSVDPTPTGNGFGGLLGAGISAMSGILQSAGLDIANSADAGALSVNPTGTGGIFGSLLGSGISAMANLLNASGNMIASSAQNGAGSVDPTSTGAAFTSTYAGGIGSGAGQAESSAESVAESSNKALGIDTSSAGYEFGAGFGGGVSSAIEAAVNAASVLAESALRTIKRILNIHSPSKETEKLGAFTGLGFAGGIEGEEKNVRKASTRISDAALNGIDVHAMAEKVRSLVDLESTKRGLAISATVTRKIVTEYEDQGVQQEEMLARLSSKLSVDVAKALKEAGIKVEMYGKVIGKLLAPEVDHQIGKLAGRLV